MRYLSVRNFWKFQNADVWKKSLGHPPWCKFYVHRDLELDLLPPTARLLWYEILACATRYTNVILNDSEWIAGETRMKVGEIDEYLPLLLKGGWLSETDTPRRSRRPSRTTRSRESSSAIRLEEKREEKGAKAPLREAPLTQRKRDEIWDALATELREQPSTKSERGRWNRAVGELREAGATPEDIKRRALEYRRRWPDAALTPTALSSNWGSLKPSRAIEAPIRCTCGKGFYSPRELAFHRQNVHDGPPVPLSPEEANA